MKQYRVTIDDQHHSEITTVVVESESKAAALFMAGVVYGRKTESPFDELVFMKIEEPAGWMEVAVR